MPKKKPSFLKMLSWSFLVSWEDSGWRITWFMLTALTAVVLGKAVALAWVGEFRVALQAVTFAAGSLVLGWLAARLHRHCNGGSVLEHYKVWKHWKRRGDR
ncbi:MAG TPA: hypothetical protein VL426_06545 [Candidatus Binatia bacterium]|jgi:hypothetical protein|nr:hypothetical protein [Candidatus Binatia bacterium]